MKIESFSIRSSTIAIFIMIGIVAVLLSLYAGSCFKRAALDAQKNSLSRVIEVASLEMLRHVKDHAFDLGTKLGNNGELISAVKSSLEPGRNERLVELLNDPFVNGFAGFSEVDLKKIRIYNLKLELIGESSNGTEELGDKLADYFAAIITERKYSDRVKAIGALWMSPEGPLFSMVVPIGGLRPIGYLEIVVDPLFNLPDIGSITQTPLRIYSISGEPLNKVAHELTDNSLPVEFTLHASDGTPAFRIVGYEDVDELNRVMEQTQVVTIGSFLLLTVCTLLFALWLFSRFLFTPVRRMVEEMEQITHGKLELTVGNKGLREFHVLANAFNSMAGQVRTRTSDLQRLLDLDDSALMCFDCDNDAVYANQGAATLFGYSGDEILDLDIVDLFSNDIAQLMKEAAEMNDSQQCGLHVRLDCKHQDGDNFQSDAIINIIDVMGASGIAIVLNPTLGSENSASPLNDQRINAMEHTLGRLLSFARDYPGNISELESPEHQASTKAGADTQKTRLRKHAVKVMSLSLACWERDLGKSKIELADESKIWPVYIDKSTPTTRTLDKYLNIDNCPKNPRCQRVIDTAEFVLKKMGSKNPPVRKQLQALLDEFRLLIAGMKVKQG